MNDLQAETNNGVSDNEPQSVEPHHEQPTLIEFLQIQHDALALLIDLGQAHAVEVQALHKSEQSTRAMYDRSLSDRMKNIDDGSMILASRDKAWLEASRRAREDIEIKLRELSLQLVKYKP
jgi:hypothetical protein